MKTAVIALTMNRAEATRQAWANNLKADTPVYWWDNTPHGADRAVLHGIASAYNIRSAFHDGSNYGIAYPINQMAARIFADGYDAFVTMASDILEPDNWIQNLTEISVLTGAGIAAVPPGDGNCGVVRYERKEINGIGYESGGDIIGNWLVTKQAYQTIGPYPEHYGIYGPIDLEYCARARKLGILAVYLSDHKSVCMNPPDDPEYILAKNKSLAEAWPIFSNVMANL